jgi:hypothetical protein
MRWTSNLKTKNVLRSRLSNVNISKRKCFVQTTVQLTSKGQTGAMAPIAATATTASTATAAMAVCIWSPMQTKCGIWKDSRHYFKKKNHFQSDYYERECDNAPMVKVQELDEDGTGSAKTVECIFISKNWDPTPLLHRERVPQSSKKRKNPLDH